MASSLRYLNWSAGTNPTLGKLRLQSMERSNVFFEAWLHFAAFDGGLNDTSSLFPVDPLSVNQDTLPKKVNVPVETTVVNGIYTDSYGAQLKQDISYVVKVYLWVETDEEANGIQFDFQYE